MLVYSNPLDPYNLLLLGCAKYELSEFLQENKKQIYSPQFFEDILRESESLLLASNSLQMDKTIKTVPGSITSIKTLTTTKNLTNY